VCIRPAGGPIALAFVAGARRACAGSGWAFAALPLVRYPLFLILVTPLPAISTFLSDLSFGP
jgi:hypothetical protein